MVGRAGVKKYGASQPCVCTGVRSWEKGTSLLVGRRNAWKAGPSRVKPTSVACVFNPRTRQQRMRCIGVYWYEFTSGQNYKGGEEKAFVVESDHSRPASHSRDQQKGRVGSTGAWKRRCISEQDVINVTRMEYLPRTFWNISISRGAEPRR